MKCPVCGTPWTMLDKSPVHPFGGWVTHCFCQHVLPGSPLYPPNAATGSEPAKVPPAKIPAIGQRVGPVLKQPAKGCEHAGDSWHDKTACPACKRCLECEGTGFVWGCAQPPPCLACGGSGTEPGRVAK